MSNKMDFEGMVIHLIKCAMELRNGGILSCEEFTEKVYAAIKICDTLNAAEQASNETMTQEEYEARVRQEREIRKAGLNGKAASNNRNH